MQEARSLTADKTDRIFDIGDVVFTQVPEAERMQHASKLAEEGSKIGYKPRQLWVRLHRVQRTDNQTLTAPVRLHVRPLITASVTSTNSTPVRTLTTPRSLTVF